MSMLFELLEKTFFASDSKNTENVFTTLNKKNLRSKKFKMITEISRRRTKRAGVETHRLPSLKQTQEKTMKTRETI